jgi:hypothetical protein
MMKLPKMEVASHTGSEIMESQIQTAPGSHQPLLPVQHATIPLDLNTTSGSSGEMFAIILREADREEHRRQREQQQEAAQERVKQVEEIKRLTAGVHFNSKKLRLGTTVLERVRAQQQKKEEAQLQKDKKKRAEQWARRRKAMEIRALNIPEDRWTKAQLKVMCTYKKHRGDTGLPDDIGLLRQVWKERQGRLSPTVSEDEQSENESDSVGFVSQQAPTTHVVLTSPTAFSTLSDLSNVSDLSNTQPVYAFNLPAKGGIEM